MAVGTCAFFAFKRHADTLEQAACSVHLMKTVAGKKKRQEQIFRVKLGPAKPVRYIYTRSGIPCHRKVLYELKKVAEEHDVRVVFSPVTILGVGELWLPCVTRGMHVNRFVLSCGDCVRRTFSRRTNFVRGGIGVGASFIA